MADTSDLCLTGTTLTSVDLVIGRLISEKHLTEVISPENYRSKSTSLPKKKQNIWFRMPVDTPAHVLICLKRI